MISDKDQKILELIERLVNLAKSKLNDSYFVQSTFADLKIIYENLEDNKLKYNIRMKAQEILITFDTSKLKVYIDELLFIIEKAREINKTYLDVDPKNVERSDRYKADCEKYALYKKNIKKLEEKIISSSEYVENLHKDITKQKSKWFGHLHARLTKNLRLMYLLNKEKKKLIFKAIITHDEYDF